MTRKDLAAIISAETGLTQEQTKAIINGFFKGVINAIKDGKHIEIREFGVFKIKTRKPRTGRNPKTGEIVQVPERKVCVFKPGLGFKGM